MISFALTSSRTVDLSRVQCPVCAATARPAEFLGGDVGHNVLSCACGCDRCGALLLCVDVNDHYDARETGLFEYEWSAVAECEMPHWAGEVACL